MVELNPGLEIKTLSWMPSVILGHSDFIAFLSLKDILLARTEHEMLKVLTY